MDKGDLPLLLKFAQIIQQKIKTETDENVKGSLEKDLLIIKNEIGKRVLELPNDTQIFPPFESSQFFDERLLYPNKEVISSIEYLPSQKTKKQTINVSPINSPVRNNRSSKLQSLSDFIDENNPDSNSISDDKSIEENSIYSFPGQPTPFVDYTADDLAAKFNKFIKQKESKKSKESKIPKPKSKIPVPKQK
ncbi:hypothetical protein M9Y10_014979 [Tritrichomonas musculus]|uniref:Uncharacterized protein n=1 Tax=Tritrichomonas musculus TaxID=1915356 RepID=A0ABR2L103_9EUKA